MFVCGGGGREGGECECVYVERGILIYGSDPYLV